MYANLRATWRVEYLEGSKTFAGFFGVFFACEETEEFRLEWLGLYILKTMEEVQECATDWLWTYNHDRPNRGIGGMTPAQKRRLTA